MSWAFQAAGGARVDDSMFGNGCSHGLHDLPCTQEILRITKHGLEELSFGFFNDLTLTGGYKENPSKMI